MLTKTSGKKILFLGAGAFQVAPIRYAKRRNYHVITCDNIPGNPGHRLADEYYNVSTIDRDKVLNLAQKLKIDSIVYYATDVSAPTGAYVAEKLCLPGNPTDAVITLTQKDKFRNLLKSIDLNYPLFESFNKDNFELALDFVASRHLPVIVKPIDSSGSKGVTKVNELKDMPVAFEKALRYSLCKKIVVEDYICREGYQIAGDGFVINGKLKFRCFGNEHFNTDVNPLVPTGESFPSVLPEKDLAKAHSQIDKILHKLDYHSGPLNFDFIFNKSGEIYFLEIGPRNGGNLIPEVVQYATGVDMVAATVETALGNIYPIDMQPVCGFYSSFVFHSPKDIVYKGVNINKEIADNIVYKMFAVVEGERVKKFDNASHALGAAILQYSSMKEMLYKMDNMSKYITIKC